jgi:2-(1,2-epoxy-1,2-dihydrophenyl)acetyl-CoA isomerase
LSNRITIKAIPPSDPEISNEGLAERFAKGPTKTIGLIKRTLNKALASDLDSLLGYEATIQEIALFTEDHIDGVATFLRKRPSQIKRE